jgi:gamma-glutamyl-gamma-aminobutyrate hydrolase PuuD
MKKVYVVGYGEAYGKWIKESKLVNTMEEADLVVFTGGEDVDPSMYNEKHGKFTSSNIRRDVKEMAEFEKANELKKPIIGICRGAQLSCVLSGGRLVQHQNNPEYIHGLVTHDKRADIRITSTHHQAQFPYELPNEEYKLLAWTEGLSKVHLDGEDKEISPEPFAEAEIVYYPKTRALGIQGHPESMSRGAHPKTFEFLDELVDKLVNNKL